MAHAYHSSLKYAATHYFRVSSPHTPKSFIENIIDENPCYSIPDQALPHDDMVQSMRNWVRQAEVLHTPSYFVNGYRLPELHNIEDPAHLL